MAKKPRQVAVILDVSSPYQRKMIRGVAAYARQAGGWRLYVEENPLDTLPDLKAWRGDGIITAFTERRYAALVRGLDLPVVGVEGGYGWYEPDSGIPYFATDDAAVAQMAADHLIGQGYSRLAFCGLPKSRQTEWGERRRRAFVARAREAGVPCHVYAGHHQSTRQWAALQRDLCTWLRSLEKPVGIMAANDARARHVLEACRSVGLRVPEDVAVIGVDNHELMCELTDPPLSSIEQGAQELGYRAAELLDQMMAGKRPRALANLVAPERVIVRRSTDTLVIGDADVAKAMRFIRDHACEHIRVADVLDQVAVSRSTLEARFRTIIGKTIRDEIHDAMLRHAQELIAAKELTLKQVAREAGFSHVQHMTNLFRRRLGRTPGEFQRLARLGGA